MQRHDPASPVQRRAVVISPDRQLIYELEPFLIQKLAGAPLSHMESYPAARTAAQQLGSAASQLVFLDVGTNPAQAVEVLQELVSLPGVQVLAMLGANDPEAILKCLRAGAIDFILRPFTAEQVEAAIGKAARLAPVSKTPTRGSNIIAVMPAKGACGSTTLACNLAFQFKRQGAQRVLLADLDPLTGTVSFLLKLKSSFSFLDVLARGSELDPDLWNTTITRTNGIDVLLSPEMAVTGMPQHVDATPILEFARHEYDVVVVDSGSVYGPWNLSQAHAANEILLLTTNELPALQAAQRALTYLTNNKVPKSKIRLVVNRYQQDVGLSREVIGTALHSDVFATLPSDYEAIQKSLMEGKAAMPTTAFGKGVVQLAKLLDAPRDKPASSKGSASGLTSLLGGLFSKGKK